MGRARRQSWFPSLRPNKKIIRANTKSIKKPERINAGTVETRPKDRFVRLNRARNARLPALLCILIYMCGCTQQPNVPGYSNRVTDPYASKRWSSQTFTTAHATLGDAAKHFAGIRPQPQQPIEFPHKIHQSEIIGIECTDCHFGASRGPRAGFASVSFCMTCHETAGNPNDPRMQLLRATAQRGEDLPWQRVYGFLEESHVRFNHAPHIRAGVECAMCHGDLAQMTVAERAVDHTMGFCINCHQQRGASNDCLTCHY